MGITSLVLSTSFDQIHPGFVKFLGPYYMLLITGIRPMGTMCCHDVYSVTESKIIPIPAPNVLPNVANSEDEKRCFCLCINSACQISCIVCLCVNIQWVKIQVSKLLNFMFLHWALCSYCNYLFCCRMWFFSIWKTKSFVMPFWHWYSIMVMIGSADAHGIEGVQSTF